MNKQRCTKLLLSVLTASLVLFFMFGLVTTKAYATIGYYKIEFYSTSGTTNIPQAFEVKDGSLYSLPTQKPLRTGYDFLGWSPSSNAKSATYSAGQGNLRASSSLKLYAVWKKTPDAGCNTYNYGVCSGSPVVGTPIRDTPSKMEVTYQKGKKSRVDYDGWAVHDQGISGYTCQVSGSGLSTSNVKLNWKRRDDLASANVLVNMGLNPKASINNTGYYGSIDISKLNPGTYKVTIYGIPNKGSRFTVSEITINIYTQYTITFDANGGKITGRNNQLYMSNASPFTLAIPVIQNGNYALRGFSTKKDGTGTIYSAKDKVSYKELKGNVKLYAIWGYRVTVDANGGTFSDGKKKEEYLLPIGAKLDLNEEKYNVLWVWNTNQRARFKEHCYFGNAYSTKKDGKSALPKNVNSNITLYAVWIDTEIRSGIFYNNKSTFSDPGIYMVLGEGDDAYQFAADLQQFVIDYAPDRDQVYEHEQAVANIIKLFIPGKYKAVRFFFDIYFYGLDKALENLGTSLTSKQVTELSTKLVGIDPDLIGGVNKGTKPLRMANVIGKSGAKLIINTKDSSFRDNYDIMLAYYQYLCNMGVYKRDGTIDVKELTLTFYPIKQAWTFSTVLELGTVEYRTGVIGYYDVFTKVGGWKGEKVYWYDYKINHDAYYVDREDYLMDNNTTKFDSFSIFYEILSLKDRSVKIEAAK